MTIKALHDMTPADHKILVGWQGNTQELDRNNALEMDAYGRYTVARIYAIDTDIIEADLLARPVKEN